MSAAALTPATNPSDGLRPIQPRRDLAAVADLIETCFADTLDTGGRAALRDMRLMARTGPLLWRLGRLTRSIPVLKGYVWTERGRIVGNVTVTPAGYDRGYVIANVAVYPDYRRRGIARALMQAALALVVQQGGRFATLQVDQHNHGARALYEALGFVDQRLFHRWRRATQPLTRPFQTGVAPGGPPLRRMTRREAPAVYALAQQVRPDTAGGMGWLRPTRRRELQPARLGGLMLFLAGRHVQQWVTHDDGGSLSAVLRAENRLGGMTMLFDLLVRPDCQGHLEAGLVHRTVERLGGRVRPLLTDHPADDRAMTDALHGCQFRLERSMVHMIWHP